MFLLSKTAKYIGFTFAKENFKRIVAKLLTFSKYQLKTLSVV